MMYVLIFISLIFAGSLKVYEGDGTTVLGNYAGCTSDTACASDGTGLSYTNTTTGAISILEVSSYTNTTFFPSGNIHFTGATCTGTALIIGVAYYYNNGLYYRPSGNYCSPCAASGSYRQPNGTCITAAGANTVYNYAVTTAAPPCGNAPCKLKP